MIVSPLLQNLLTIMTVVICAAGVGMFVRRGTTISALSLMQKNIEGYKGAIDLEVMRQKNLADQLVTAQEARVLAEKAVVLAEETRVRQEKRANELAALIATHELERQTWHEEKARLAARVAELEQQVRTLQDQFLSHGTRA